MEQFNRSCPVFSHYHYQVGTGDWYIILVFKTLYHILQYWQTIWLITLHTWRINIIYTPWYLIVTWSHATFSLIIHLVLTFRTFSLAFSLDCIVFVWGSLYTVHDLLCYELEDKYTTSLLVLGATCLQHGDRTLNLSVVKSQSRHRPPSPTAFHIYVNIVNLGNN